jgi:hypothetical protein
MSKEMREQIERVKNWEQFLNEGKSKPINITSGFLPYIEHAFNSIKKVYGNKYDLNGYTLSAFEFNTYHNYCPYGFDMDIDRKNKRIHVDICSQNDGYNMGGFREAIYDELESILIGSTIYNTPPVVKKTEYDLPIKV